jgi:hypothetical protein
MLLFRSGEHLRRWLSSGAGPAGESLNLEQQWHLAQDWFTGRDLPEWTKRSAEEAEAVFLRSGLTSDFWRLS